MTTRREFLQAGIAVSALPLGTTIRAASPTATIHSDRRLPFYKVVFDERFADSVVFGAAMEARGATLQAIRGDITDFWYRELSGVWRETPIAVAGLTAHGPLFCLEQLARDHRMRVVLRAMHEYRPEGCLHHTIAAPDTAIGRTAGLGSAGAAWSAVVATLVGSCGGGRPTSATTIVTPRAHAIPDPGGHETLYSWVIAPAAAV